MTDDLAVSTSPTLLYGLRDDARREEAWRIFLARYHPLIRGWCTRSGLPADDAEEICSVVLSKLVRVMKDFVYDPTRRFRSWLRKVVINEINSLRRRRRIHPGDFASGDDRVHGLLNAFPAPAADELLAAALGQSLERDLRRAHDVVVRVRERIETKTWQAYWATAIDGEEANDVAGRLGMSIPAVYMAKCRVGRMLREEGDRLLDGPVIGNGGKV
jgi:RNA polymerase sigma-70 factor (ECF subfamily)